MRVEPFAELVKEHMRYRTIEQVAASAPKPDAFKRRLYDILHGKTQTISLRVADEMAVVMGHPEWLQLI